jgi:hypothetical protein
MQGIYVNGGSGARRPKSKAEVKRELASNPSGVSVEATSLHGNEPDGRITDPHTFPTGTEVHFVGPDPYRDRKFYGTITIVSNDPFKATVR